MDMYAKCGAVDYSRRIFGGIQSKDLISWNTVPSGYAINGRMTEATGLFDELLDSGLCPDGITLLPCCQVVASRGSQMRARHCLTE